MQQLYRVICFFIVMNLTGCAAYSSDNSVAMSSATQIKTADNYKDPVTIPFYPKDNPPKTPYKIIAKEKISSLNAGGIKRQEATIHEMFRQLAADMGGDAIIEFSRDQKEIAGEVIKFNV